MRVYLQATVLQVPRVDWTTSKGAAIIQGSDFVQTLPFRTFAELADNWTGYAARGKIRRAPADIDTVGICDIVVTILDPRTRLVRFWIPNATTLLIGQGSPIQGTWDAELYSTSDGYVQMFVQGRWNLWRENAR